ncbi:MAG: adenylate kinase [Steroidobacter sp.]
MMRIVLLGAPGSGKGTQAQRLQAKYAVPQASSGDLLRDAVARGTELGLKAKAVMDAGRLVSDDIVLGLIRDRLNRPDAAEGFILDGFPRNIDQANSLSKLLAELGQPLDAVLLLDVRKETLMRRLAGRRICPKCGTVYNVHSMAPGATGCARDGAELYQRPDDKEEVIGKRLEVYEQQTRPLVEHYSARGLLRVIAGEGELDEVFERMESAALTKGAPASKVKLAREAGRVSKAVNNPSAKDDPAKSKRGAAVRGKSSKRKLSMTKTAQKKAARKKSTQRKSTQRKSTQTKPTKNRSSAQKRASKSARKSVKRAPATRGASKRRAAKSTPKSGKRNTARSKKR